MALNLVIAPTAALLTLAEARLQARVDATGSPPAHPDDDLLTAYVKAAEGELDGRDGWLGRALLTQTWDLLLDEFPSDGGIRVPLPPLQAIVSLGYLDGNGDSQTLAATDYRLDAESEPAFIAAPSAGWPTTFDTLNAVTVRFRAGYGAASDVPELIRQYARMRVASWYAARETVIFGASVAPLPWVEHSLASYRVWGAHV